MFELEDVINNYRDFEVVYKEFEVCFLLIMFLCVFVNVLFYWFFLNN